jgi:hypothetical protein
VKIAGPTVSKNPCTSHLLLLLLLWWVLVNGDVHHQCLLEALVLVTGELMVVRVMLLLLEMAMQLPLLRLRH